MFGKQRQSNKNDINKVDMFQIDANKLDTLPKDLKFSSELNKTWYVGADGQ